MKDKKSPFDVWIRIKPFSRITVSDFTLMSPKKGARTIEKSPSRSQFKTRSKSPINGTVMSKIRQEQSELDRTDYKGLLVQHDQIIIDPDDQSNNSKLTRSKNQVITFPSIINESQTNEDIFEIRLSPLLSELFQGKSFTMMTYGISGSGKSHTIFGNTGTGEFGGLLNCCNEIFRQKELLRGDRDIKLNISFMEIYNEKVFDLLSNEVKNLAIVESPYNNGVIVPELEVKEVLDFAELKALVSRALVKRIVSPNLNNMNSSRSHVVVEVSLSQTDLKDGKKYASKVRFVDLAGSEKVYLEEKDLMQEGSNINKSLLSLTNCINILSDDRKRNTAFIPYRNSKLTRILKDSLGTYCLTRWRCSCLLHRLFVPKWHLFG